MLCVGCIRLHGTTPENADTTRMCRGHMLHGRDVLGVSTHISSCTRCVQNCINAQHDSSEISIRNMSACQMVMSYHSLVLILPTGVQCPCHATAVISGIHVINVCYLPSAIS